MNEIWKEIPNMYGAKVSNKGNVYLSDAGSVITRDGYRILSISKTVNGKRKTTQVRIGKTVLELFSGTTGNKVKHKDGNTLNDDASNLEWHQRITPQEKGRRRLVVTRKEKETDPALWHSKHMATNAYSRIKYASKRKKNYVGKEFGFSDSNELANYLYFNFKDDILNLIEKRKYPTIDRIDNDLGYIEGNIRVISFKENTRLGLEVLKEKRKMNKIR